MAMAAPEPLDCFFGLKVLNFDFLLDSSGSMMMRHKHLGRNKFELAKQILRRVNDRIPELGYTGSIHTFGDNKQVLAPQIYSRIEACLRGRKTCWTMMMMSKDSS